MTDDTAALAAWMRELLRGSEFTIESFPTRPDGPARQTVRVVADECSVIATRRCDADGGAMEAEVLETLAAAGAPVPAFIGYRSGWLVQEDSPAPRCRRRFTARRPQRRAIS